ncbi:MAG: hypothetical protein ACK4L8_13110 [Nitrincola lacisaponensis]|uniref:hypothetical protein n=1 Tax=Nitrincola lacisaponensis TaxID=267850 RepID=UPI00391A62D1
MSNYRYLRQFKQDELLFDEDETRIILKFIFKPVDHELIDSLPMSDSLRGFTQGLLLEAIDASYAVGYVRGIFESAANPQKGAIEIIKSFGRKASRHWFKNASVHDLQNVKIYNFIIDEIAARFRVVLMDFLAVIEINKSLGAFLSYKVPSQGIVRRWG